MTTRQAAPPYAFYARFIHGIHRLKLVHPAESDGTIAAGYELIHSHRLAQEIGYIRLGNRSRLGC